MLYMFIAMDCFLMSRFYFKIIIIDFLVFVSKNTKHMYNINAVVVWLSATPLPPSVPKILQDPQKYIKDTNK